MIELFENLSVLSAGIICRSLAVVEDCIAVYMFMLNLAHTLVFPSLCYFCTKKKNDINPAYVTDKT